MSPFHVGRLFPGAWKPRGKKKRCFWRLFVHKTPSLVVLGSFWASFVSPRFTFTGVGNLLLACIIVGFCVSWLIDVESQKRNKCSSCLSLPYVCFPYRSLPNKSWLLAIKIDYVVDLLHGLARLHIEVYVVMIWNVYRAIQRLAGRTHPTLAMFELDG